MTRSKVFGSGSAIVAVVVVLASACIGGPRDGRRANTLEFAYEYLAPGLRMPELCDKISPRAFLTASMSPRGYQVTYTRSDCYFNLALETHQPDYCSHVVAARSLLLDGSKQTEAQCRKTVAEGRGLQATGGDLEWVMRFMGYASVDSAFGGWVQTYYALRSSDALRSRARLLPDFSARDGPVHVGARYADLGCRGDDAREWYCYAYRCLASADEQYREACLEIAGYLRTRQVEEAEGRTFGLTGHEAELLKKYPALKPR